ncbi:hypothetical protein MNV_1800031 [Candidatus Methanoperedens nitroreducens]|uniref:Uncharacterized protein n=1 Tax=Candidatus Methanoperedens nitratireducens TaxID=1392998 RepID=A0A284VMM1_9EURY|nr:hypothetical protein MNV_1800031 [Candidatus Methanoperedens nitroreducens]
MEVVRVVEISTDLLPSVSVDSAEDTEKCNNSLCSLRPLWLIIPAATYLSRIN